MSDTCTLLFPQDGDSPLHIAAYLGNLDIVEFLVLRGADLSLCNKVSVIVNWQCSVVGSCMVTAQLLCIIVQCSYYLVVYSNTIRLRFIVTISLVCLFLISMSHFM